MTTFVFLDTNIFLHYQDFDQINWFDILRNDRITLVIPPVIVRELNHQKDSSQYTKNIRTRAGKTLIKLDTYFNSDIRAIVKQGIEIFLEDRDPLIDFHAYNLSRDVNDDQLIASIIMLKEEDPNHQYILVTSDSGLTLSAKARSHGIMTVRLGNNYKLKEGPDPEHEKIKELQQELKRVKLTIPDMSLVFETNTQHVAFTLKQPSVLTNEDIDERLAEVKNRLSKINELPTNISENKSASIEDLSSLLSMNMRFPFNSVSSEDIGKYNNALDKYFGKYPEYLRGQNDFENRKLRTICLEIYLDNKGTAPGEDMDIFMYFPNGFRLVDDIPSPPIELKPPDSPKTQMEKILNGGNLFSGIHNLPFENLRNFPQPPSNVSSPNIKQTNSYEVNVQVKNMKHGLKEQLDPLYVIFDSYESSRSFQIDYRILAANVPQEIKGKLHVVINKENLNLPMS